VSSSSSPPGLQQERTALSWRRTSLALGVLSLLIARVALEDADAAPAALSVAAVGGALWLVVATLRHRWTITSPTDPDLAVLRDGRLPLAVVAIVMILCVAVALLALRVTG
jgi:uncharacterized membrane protein YidH (DUF202 family)